METKGAIRVTCATYMLLGYSGTQAQEKLLPYVPTNIKRSRGHVPASLGQPRTISRQKRRCCSGIVRASFNRRCSARANIGHAHIDMFTVDHSLQGYKVTDNQTESFLKIRPLGELLLHEYQNSWDTPYDTQISVCLAGQARMSLGSIEALGPIKGLKYRCIPVEKQLPCTQLQGSSTDAMVLQN